MFQRHARLAFALALACLPAAMPAQAQAPAREVVGNRTTENIPAIPPALIERLSRYQNTRGAALAGWTRDGCLLISTRFAETSQAHRVCQPLGMREQLTFFAEPVGSLAPAPAGAPRDGFVYTKDKGGDEFSQVWWFDAATREQVLLSDGGRSQNGGIVLARDGSLLAYGGTGRNGKDRDIYLRDMRSGATRRLFDADGSWGPVAFSPDGKQLVVMQGVSVAESRPAMVDLASGKLTPFPVEGGKAAFGGFRYTPDGKALYYVSDEPIAGQPQEFSTLRRRDLASGRVTPVSAQIPWDVEEFELSDDGSRLAYVTNEGGASRLRVLSLPDHREIALPALPIGVIGGLAFSPDGKRLALSLNSGTSPSDVHVIDLAARRATAWTRSEVGGLDTAKFIAPTLIQYPTFDQVDGKPRMIPAFYYQPAGAAAGKRMPVIINIHGGPEGQSFATFAPATQFLANELGVAMLVPNVRGSTGYGKTYVSLDNAARREDSVRDIGALLDWIARQPELDAGRVGVMGGSYGGYMTLASLEHFPERIRAGIDVVGISDFTTFLNNTEAYRRDLRRVEYGDERDPAMQEVFKRISPLGNAHKIKSALFVAQGRNDPRVPYTEAEQIVKAARANGGPVWYLLFDDEGHGFRKKSNTDYFGAASVLFWQRYLLDDGKR